jgi:general secretion pathway protein E
MVFLDRFLQVNLLVAGSAGYIGRMLMLTRNTSAPPATFIEFLKDLDPLKGGVDQTALSQATSSGRGHYHDLWEAGVLPGAELADAIASFHNLPRANAEQIQYRAELFEGLSRRFLRDAWIFPFLDDGALALAVADPTREEAIRAVMLALGESAAIEVAAFDELTVWFEQDPSLLRSGPGAEAAADDEAEAGAEENLQRLQDLASGAPVVHTVDALLDTAVKLSATDIHIEPARDGVRVRLRVDGLLRNHQSLPGRMARAVVSRVKILAGLNIAERRLPQDGRARVRVGETEADLRVATMPTLHGEAVVIRILVKEARALDLSRLGMASRDLSIMTEQLAEPHGLIVVSGPTGSGKTTTLAAALSTLNHPERKIMTIEDPIEYQIPGIHQTQVKPSIDLTFATALRSFLRHDPDIMMVGELRDRETATIGIQAALTGHLVLTTLHTNSAADSIVRLVDLGVESFLLVSALRCVVGQRLVRKLCERCRTPVSRLPAAAMALVDKGLFLPPANGLIYAAAGCNWCGKTGYRGRIGIFEVLKLDPEMRSLIRRNVDPVAIEQRAKAAGMTTMLQDGLAKYCAGVTSVEEVLRATS